METESEMRVIAGKARRLNLKTIPGIDTRPTTDRIKETLFNILQPELLECRFLDLFSGSGGIGIEALSRGASYAVFVEKNPKAAACIRENLAFTKLAEDGKLLNMDVLQALRWILENKRYYGIRVVNISVGTTCRRAEDHRVLIAGVEQLWDAGLVVVAAAGNQGPKAGSVTAPGSSRKIITVGSSDLLTGRTAISGRGPTFECVCKPDLVAPGNHVLACAPGADNGYGVKSGTSMSTPLVAGAAALMLEKNPELTNVQIKMKLKESARDMGLPKNQQGWGELDLERFMEL